MELLDIVNENDEVVGAATRKEAGEKGFIVRIAAVLMFNSKGNLILQRISKNKKDDKDAGKWSYSAGGHVDAGETYEQAAIRELKEEMGVDGIIDSYIGMSRAIRPSTGKQGAFHRAFKVYHDGPFDFDPTEAEEIREFSIDEIKEMLKTDKTQFKSNVVEMFKIMGFC